MNIQSNGINLMRNYGLKSTKDRLERIQKRDDQIDFIQRQKDGLKNLKSESIEDIKRKLDLINTYDEQIATVKAEFNHTQMYHMMDEAMEIGEKIAKEVEKAEPKTREERIEDLVEEATGVEKNGGILSEVMEQIEDVIEVTEKEMLENSNAVESMNETIPQEDENMLKEEGLLETAGVTKEERLSDLYKRIDLRV